MIDYLESALGLAEGSLTSDLGVMICSVMLFVSFYAIIKVILSWFEVIFRGK